MHTQCARHTATQRKVTSSAASRSEPRTPTYGHPKKSAFPRTPRLPFSFPNEPYDFRLSGLFRAVPSPHCMSVFRRRTCALQAQNPKFNSDHPHRLRMIHTQRISQINLHAQWLALRRVHALRAYVRRSCRRTYTELRDARMRASRRQRRGRTVIGGRWTVVGRSGVGVCRRGDWNAVAMR
jgi:hypothetical protein